MDSKYRNCDIPKAKPISDSLYFILKIWNKINVFLSRAMENSASRF
jgi:hypothetical protein